MKRKDCKFKMKIRFLFAWYDFWIGWYWDLEKKRLYILPFPMIGFYISFKKKKEKL